MIANDQNDQNDWEWLVAGNDQEKLENLEIAKKDQE